MNNLDVFNTLVDEEIDVEIPNDEDGVSALAERKLLTEKSDRSLPDLVRMINSKSLNLSPSYQRDFVWKEPQQSKFIESILLGIPVPTIFISENQNSTFEVVDGQQRLTTIKRFWNDELKLKELSTLTEYNGKFFSNLDETTKNLLENTRTMSVVSILKDSSPEIKFDIFQRINEGAIKLSPQELRNVIYRGPIIDLLEELSQTDTFIKLFNVKSNTVVRKQHQEIILRMLSIDDMTTLIGNELILSNEYNGRLDSAMSRFLEKYRYNEYEINRLRSEFIDTMNKIDRVLDDKKIFRVYSLEKETKNLISKPLAEFEYILFKNLSIEVINRKLESLPNLLGNIFDSEDKLILFQRATANKDTVLRRISLINSLINGEEYV